MLRHLKTLALTAILAVTATQAPAMFIQPDWFETTDDGVGTNRYSYSFNDPVNLSDPSGNDVTFHNDGSITSYDTDSDGNRTGESRYYASQQDYHDYLDAKEEDRIRRNYADIYAAFGRRQGQYYSEFSLSTRNGPNAPRGGFGFSFLPKNPSAAYPSILKPLPGKKLSQKPHIWKFHIEKSVRQMRNRLINNPRVTRTSSFNTRRDAELAVRAAIYNNRAAFDRWHGAARIGERKYFDSNMATNGTAVIRTPSGLQTVPANSNARIVFERVPSSVAPNGFRVYTGYPY